MKVGIQTSQYFNILITVQCCPLPQEVHKNNTFLIPKDCNHDFSSWRYTVEFFLLWDVIFHRLPLEYGFTMVDPGFIPYDNLQHEALTSSTVLVQIISDNCFPCPFARICQHLCHQMSLDFEIARLFKNYHYIVFNDQQGGAHFISCYAMVAEIITHLVTKYCSSCFQLLYSILPIAEQYSRSQ